jgi:hypothetical protein
MKPSQYLATQGGWQKFDTSVDFVRLKQSLSGIRKMKRTMMSIGRFCSRPAALNRP